MENEKIGKIVIGKQFEGSENYEELIRQVQKKKIPVVVLKQGDHLKVSKDAYINILWPDEDRKMGENVINNNSLVLKFCYRDFSMLFTGDIEEKAENAILEKYQDKQEMLKASVLKVGHHGSKTSSTKEFLEAVQPKIALIGVGENNKFGHPSNITLENLNHVSCKVYRTDENGEITLHVNRKGKIWIDKMLN